MPLLKKTSVSLLDQLFYKRALSAIVLIGGVALSGTAHADSAAPDLNLDITQSDGTSWSLDLNNLVTVNPTTGVLSLIPKGTPLTGNWSWSKVGVLDPVSGNMVQQTALTWSSDQTAGGNPDSTITFYAAGDADPFLSYGFTARNSTSIVQTYSFSYGEALSPAFSGPYSLYNDIAGSLTHGTITPYAQIAPVSGSAIQRLSFSTDGGVSFFNAGVDVGPGAQTTTASGTVPYGTFSATSNGTTAPINYWQFDTAFTLTPGRDVASLSGFAELDEIPEVSTYSLAVGALALGWVALKRRRSLG